MRLAIPTVFTLTLAGLALATPADASDPRITLLPQPPGVYADGLNPHWNPTPDQADAALTGVIRYFDNLETQPGIDEGLRRYQSGVRTRFADYRFQAYGVTAKPGNNWPGLNGKGARIVELSAVCNYSPKAYPNWDRYPLAFIDGGNCYFRAFWDVDKERMAWVSVN